MTLFLLCTLRAKTPHSPCLIILSFLSWRPTADISLDMLKFPTYRPQTADSSKETEIQDQQHQIQTSHKRAAANQSWPDREIQWLPRLFWGPCLAPSVTPRRLGTTDWELVDMFDCDNFVAVKWQYTSQVVPPLPSSSSSSSPLACWPPQVRAPLRDPLH